MGMCNLSGGVTPVYGPYGKNIEDIEDCAPNSRTDYFDEVTGKLLQQRWYDSEGRAAWDRDWDHGNKHKDTFPHDHYWEWEKDKKHPPRPKYFGPSGEKINKHYY